MLRLPLGRAISTLECVIPFEAGAQVAGWILRYGPPRLKRRSPIEVKGVARRWRSAKLPTCQRDAFMRHRYGRSSNVRKANASDGPVVGSRAPVRGS